MLLFHNSGAAAPTRRRRRARMQWRAGRRWVGAFQSWQESNLHQRQDRRGPVHRTEVLTARSAPRAAEAHSAGCIGVRPPLHPAPPWRAAAQRGQVVTAVPWPCLHVCHVSEIIRHPSTHAHCTTMTDRVDRSRYTRCDPVCGVVTTRGRTTGGRGRGRRGQEESCSACRKWCRPLRAPRCRSLTRR